MPQRVSDDDATIAICDGCGGKNPAGSSECDWCGRPYISQAGRLRVTVWQVLSSLLLLGLIGAIAALAYLNAGRALPPVRASAAATTAPAPTIAPTLAVTPRVTAPLTTPTPAQAAPTPAPTEEPTPEPSPTPSPRTARIANTSGLGVRVRLQPGPQAQQAGVLREGTLVLLTGNDQTVAARPWREIETEDHNLKGWVQGDFLQQLPAP